MESAGPLCTVPRQMKIKHPQLISPRQKSFGTITAVRCTHGTSEVQTVLSVSAAQIPDSTLNTELP